MAEVNRQLPARSRLALAPDTVLVGPDGRLDSLGLVNLVVAVEQRVEDELGRSVVLTDERTLGAADTVLATVGALARHIEQLLGGDAGDGPAG